MGSKFGFVEELKKSRGFRLAIPGYQMASDFEGEALEGESLFSGTDC